MGNPPSRPSVSYTLLPSTTTTSPQEPVRLPSFGRLLFPGPACVGLVLAILFPILFIGFITTGGIMNNRSNHPHVSVYDFSVVEGFFAHDNPKNGQVDSAVLPRLGLLDESPDRWINFRISFAQLKRSASKGTLYKVLYIQRHGQGFHNVAESKYGTESWNAHWSKLYTDGTLTWGPDPPLTTLGISQALEVNRVWKEELALEDGRAPELPGTIWTSPLRRAAATLNHTYSDTALSQGLRPVFKENLRESIGTHTCDARSTSYFLATTFSGLENPTNPLHYDFEPDFAVNDELWKPDVRETSEEQQARTRIVLGEIFEGMEEDYVGLVGHGGTIGSFFTVVGHKACNAPTGAFIPVVVKAVRR